MKHTKLIMGMPISIEVIDKHVTNADIENIFNYFVTIDERFSTYQPTSEISRINAGEIPHDGYSNEMKLIFNLSEQTKRETHGYFDIQRNDGSYEPAGLVKGWAILQASKILEKNGFHNFYVDAGGDIQVGGVTSEGNEWHVGIRNPFKREEVIKVLHIKDKGVATSGTSIRGQHIYDPFHKEKPLTTIVSLTVIGPNIYEADRFATAAFAMEEQGIAFIENLIGFEAYMIDKQGLATFTSGFPQYVVS